MDGDEQVGIADAAEGAAAGVGRAEGGAEERLYPAGADAADDFGRATGSEAAKLASSMSEKTPGGARLTTWRQTGAIRS